VHNYRVRIVTVSLLMWIGTVALFFRLQMLYIGPQYHGITKAHQTTAIGYWSLTFALNIVTTCMLSEFSLSIVV